MEKQSEEKIKDEIYKLENEGLEVSDEVVGFYYKDWEKFKEAIKKAKLEAYKKGKQDKEKEIMNRGHFITSMNRKVCYNAGYEKGKQDGYNQAIKDTYGQKEK